MPTRTDVIIGRIVRGVVKYTSASRALLRKRVAKGDRPERMFNVAVAHAVRAPSRADPARLDALCSFLVQLGGPTFEWPLLFELREGCAWHDIIRSRGYVDVVCLLNTYAELPALKWAIRDIWRDGPPRDMYIHFIVSAGCGSRGFTDTRSLIRAK